MGPIGGPLSGAWPLYTGPAGGALYMGPLDGPLYMESRWTSLYRPSGGHPIYGAASGPHIYGALGGPIYMCLQLAPICIGLWIGPSIWATGGPICIGAFRWAPLIDPKYTSSNVTDVGHIYICIAFVLHIMQLHLVP